MLIINNEKRIFGFVVEFIWKISYKNLSEIREPSILPIFIFLRHAFQNSDFVVLFLDPKLLNNGAVRSVYDAIRITKFLFSHCRSKFLWKVSLGLKILNLWLSSYLLNTKVRKKSAIKFVLWWNLLNKTGKNSFLPYFP
jgi:hypothetical protein